MLRRLAPATPLTSSTSYAATPSFVYATKVLSIRCVQFQATTEYNQSINKGKKEGATKWITKSTKDYTAEATRTLTSSPMKDKLKAKGASQRREADEILENSDKIFEREMDRLQDFKQKRWRKSTAFFKRQGIAFICFYICSYFVCLFLLYVGFASGWVNKEYAYGALSFLITDFGDREGFFKRVEAWDTYVNFGFAFVINEALEIVRLPFIMFTFYTFRPLLMGLGRKAKASIFKRSAPEL